MQAGDAPCDTGGDDAWDADAVGSAEEWMAQGLAYNKQGKIQAAVTAYTTGLFCAPEGSPQHTKLLLSRCELLVALHKFQEALADAEACTTQRPSDHQGFAAKGRVLLKMGRAQNAADNFARATQLCPTAHEKMVSSYQASDSDPTLYLRLAAEQGNAQAKSMLDVMTWHAAEDGGRASCVQGNEFARQGRYEEALITFSAALATAAQEGSEEHALLLAGRCEALIELTRIQEALVDAEACMKLYPEHRCAIPCYILRAREFLKSGRVKEADEAHLRVTKMDQDWAKAIWNSYHEHKIDPTGYLNAAAKQGSDEVAIILSKAICETAVKTGAQLFQQGEFQEAVDIYSRSLKNVRKGSEEHAMLLAGRCRALVMLNRISDTLVDVETFKERYSEHHCACECYMLMGDAMLRAFSNGCFGIKNVADEMFARATKLTNPAYDTTETLKKYRDLEIDPERYLRLVLESRYPVRSILSQNLSPKIEAQFNEFKAKQMEQEGGAALLASTQRAQTTENLRSFSQSQKQKEDTKKGDKPAKKLTLNPMAKFNAKQMDHWFGDAQVPLDEVKLDQEAKVRDMASNNTKAIATIGRFDTLADMARNYTKAIATAREGSEEHATLLYNRSNALLQLGELPEALEDAEACVKLSPSAERFGAKGLVLLNMGRVREADEAYAQATELDPTIRSRVADIYKKYKIDPARYNTLTWNIQNDLAQRGSQHDIVGAVGSHNEEHESQPAHRLLPARGREGRRMTSKAKAEAAHREKEAKKTEQQREEEKQRADAAMAALLEEEGKFNLAESRKKKKKSKSKNNKKELPRFLSCTDEAAVTEPKAPHEETGSPKELVRFFSMEDGLPDLPPGPSEKVDAATSQRHADEALEAALEQGGLESIVSALSDHRDHASTDVVARARSARDKIKKDRKKVARAEQAEAQKLAAEAEKRAKAEALLQRLANEEGMAELQLALTEAESFAGVLPELDDEVFVTQERLTQLRAVAKARAIEEHQDCYEAHAAAALAVHVVDDSKPSADGMPMASADAENPEATQETGNECVVCMDAPASHALAPCGHQCVCEACINVGEECPMCRVTVTFKMKIFKT